MFLCARFPAVRTTLRQSFVWQATNKSMWRISSGVRRSWRAGADCKSVGLSLSWFESSHSHQEMPTKYGRFFVCVNMADFRDVFRMFCGDNILYVYRVRQNPLFFQNYIQSRFFNWRFISYNKTHRDIHIRNPRFLIVMIQ